MVLPSLWGSDRSQGALQQGPHWPGECRAGRAVGSEFTLETVWGVEGLA